MQLLAWSDSLRTHIDVIDRQHRGLVDMVNATAARLSADSDLSGDEVRLLLGYLKEYAEVHFSTEEALMALCGLPPDYSDAHHLNHARFLEHVGDMVDELSDDAVLDGQQLLTFLGDWLIRHIKGEDQGLARRLQTAHLAAAAALPAAVRALPADSGGSPFADALARSSADLHESEGDVLALIEEGDAPALVIALDAALLPAAVVHVNRAAAERFGCCSEKLQECSVDRLFGAQSARLPVLISEVLVSGSYEGMLSCVDATGVPFTAPARVTHLCLQGQMAILMIFERAAAPNGAVEAPVRAALAEAARGQTVLSRHALFAGLEEDERVAVEAASRLIRCRKGEVLCRPGEPAADLYVVISGQVSLVLGNARGAEKVLRIVTAGEVFGEVEALTGTSCQAVAQCVSPAVLLAIPVAVLRELHARSTAFAAAALAHLGRRVNEVLGEIGALTLNTAMERIIDLLLAHARINDRGALEALLPAQKQVIASYLNLTPPTLSRAFQQLTDAGLISVSRRYVSIPDRDALLRYRAQAAG